MGWGDPVAYSGGKMRLPSHSSAATFWSPRGTDSTGFAVTCHRVSRGMERMGNAGAVWDLVSSGANAPRVWRKEVQMWYKCSDVILTPEAVRPTHL